MKRGYKTAQVDEFMARAREEVDNPQTPPAVTAADVRSVGFDLQRRGYDVAHIDAALARIEAAFAARERDDAIQASGEASWTEGTREKARVVLARIRRPRRERFTRAGTIHYGYAISDVDALVERVDSFLTKGTELSDTEIRSAVFGRKRNGYAEWQVDAVLDRTLEIILAIQ